MRTLLRRWLKTTIVLPILALASFACAYRGWTIQGVRQEDAFFLSLEALKLGSEYKKSDGWAGNQWLEAARLFGLAFYFLTLLKALGVLLRTQLNELVAQVSSRDLVCIGNHPTLESIARTAALNGRRTLWLGGVEHADLPRRARAIHRSWQKSMIKQFRLTRARSCVVAFEDDMAAVDTTLQLSAVFEDTVILLPSGSDTADAVRELQPRANVRTIPIAQPIARTLHEMHPPFLATRAEGQHALDVLILGRGGMAEALMTDLLLSSLTSFLEPPRITFVTADAPLLAAEFAMRFPELKRSAVLGFIDSVNDEDGWGVTTALMGWKAAVTNAYVCLSDDRRSLAAASALSRLAAEQGWPVKSIFVHQRCGGEVWRGSATLPAEPRCLVPFGDYAQLAWSLGLLEDEYDGAARHLHDAYRSFASSSVAEQSWEMLSQDLRDANRRQAMHLLAKLASVGVSVNEWVAQRTSGIVSPPLPAFPDLNSNPMLQDRLARLEHERWMVERRLNGWQYGDVRDSVRRRHPDLVAYDELSQRSKDYDLEMVRALADCRRVES